MLRERTGEAPQHADADRLHSMSKLEVSVFGNLLKILVGSLEV